MAKQLDDMVPRMLREIQQTLADVRGKVYQHDERFADLQKAIEDWQETTATGVGLASHANLRVQAIETQIAELRQRLERLEEKA